MNDKKFLNAETMQADDQPSMVEPPAQMTAGTNEMILENCPKDLKIQADFECFPASEKLRSVYVHIPFCRTICSYCAFYRSASLKNIEAWLQAVTLEAETALAALKRADPSFQIETLYFGGGTPSVLNHEQLARLAAVFRPYLAGKNRKNGSEKTAEAAYPEFNSEFIADVSDNPKFQEKWPAVEWTMEINPEGLTQEDLQFFHDLGINRLSIGIQSFSDDSLKRMNRMHTADEAERTVRVARTAGFDNISVDLIYGLPWTDMQDLQNDLDHYIKLDIDHLSIYSLQIEEDSVFGRQNLSPIDEDLEADMYEYLCRELEASGYEHYEISSFAREAKYSRHNLAYWSDQPYLALGTGSSGYTGKVYYHHEENLKDYLAGHIVLKREEDLDPAFAAIMMGLRTKTGIHIPDWQKKYSRDFQRFEEALKPYACGLEYVNGYLRANDAGMEILNSILVAILDEF